MGGEGDQLDNWDYIDNIRWILLGPKFWMTHSKVFERGFGRRRYPSWEFLYLRRSIRISITWHKHGRGFERQQLVEDYHANV